MIGMDEGGLVTTSSGDSADLSKGKYIFHPLKGDVGLSLGEGSIWSMSKLYTVLENYFFFYSCCKGPSMWGSNWGDVSQKNLCPSGKVVADSLWQDANGAQTIWISMGLY